MYFSIDKDTLLDPLVRVSSAIKGGGSSIPILSQVLIHVEDTYITLIGSNIETEIQERIHDVIIRETGKFACTAQMLLDYCRHSPADSTLIFRQQDRQLSVNRSTKSKDPDTESESFDDGEGQTFTDERVVFADQIAKLTDNSMFELLLDPDDFPFMQLENVTWDLQFDIDRYSLRSILKRTEHAMGVEETRFYLNATMLEIEDKVIRSVATDAHRMAICEVPLDSALGLEENMRHRVVMPRKTVVELIKVLSTLTSRVTVRFKDTHVNITTPNFSFSSKLLEANFPDWRASMPLSPQLAFRANRSELHGALNTIGILSSSNKERLTARMIASDGHLEIKAKSSQKNIHEAMSVEENDGTYNLEMHYRYLLDVLDSAPEQDSVDVYVKNNTCVIKFTDDAASSDLIMLMKNR